MIPVSHIARKIRCTGYREPKTMKMMRRGGSTIHRVCGVGLAAGVLASLIGGCQWTKAAKPTPPPVVVAPLAPPAPLEPALRVSSDAHLTLFGELPGQSRVPFQARAAVPMEQHSFTTEGADFDLDISPDGAWIVFSSTRHSSQPDLYLKRIHGRAVTKLTDDPAADVQPAFSPDGQSVVFASYRGGNWDLWRIGLGGGQATQMTRSPDHEVHPTWSPDGHRLAYCLFNRVSNQWELWTLQLDRPGSQRMIGVGLYPEWSPTTDSIIYQRARERGGRWFSVWRVDLELGEPKFPIELASSAEMALIQPSWSPDGEWITYGTAELGQGGVALPEGSGATLTRGDIWIIAADGSSPLQLTDGAGVHFGSIWSPDNRVYFSSRQTGSENIWSIKPVLAGVTQLPTASKDKAVGAPRAEALTPSREANQGG